MSAAILFAVFFLYTAVVWIVVLFIYSALIEPFEFGVLSTFAWKSAVLVGCVSAVAVFVPYGGWLTLFVWALGLLILFQKGPWEFGILILMIWATNFVIGWGIRLLLVSTRETTQGL